MKRTVVSLVFGTLLFASAFAKCITAPYEIVGRITGSAGQVIPDALIEISWSEVHGKAVRNLTVKTDASGGYLVRLSYAEFGGRDPSGEACVPVVSEVHLRVSAAGFSSHEKTLKIAGVRTTANKSLQPIAPKVGASVER